MFQFLYKYLTYHSKISSRKCKNWCIFIVNKNTLVPQDIKCLTVLYMGFSILYWYFRSVHRNVCLKFSARTKFEAFTREMLIKGFRSCSQRSPPFIKAGSSHQHKCHCCKGFNYRIQARPTADSIPSLKGWVHHLNKTKFQAPYNLRVTLWCIIYCRN